VDSGYPQVNGPDGGAEEVGILRGLCDAPRYAVDNVVSSLLLKAGLPACQEVIGPSLRKYAVDHDRKIGLHTQTHGGSVWQT
jgi:hypothetical protein